MTTGDTPDINEWFALAAETINYTAQNLFLTGKAGTGKTTFLRYIKENTHKNTIVIAPTGVAAINAGGVTMHSFFQLPFLPYLSEKQNNATSNWVNRYTLLKGLRLSKEKGDIINQLELLIIDEVSMLRADMLDAIHEILCYVRGNKKPFGGVQVLFIGDLFQLPPVIQDHESAMMQDYYQSPFFFSAKILEDNLPLFIELKHVYRQSEAELIDLLNNIRHNTLTPDDYTLLNKHVVDAGWDKPEGTITLTTHNRTADDINRRELQKLPGKGFLFVGEVKGNFSDKALPADLELHLKPGAQVMFTKNDSSGEKRYYNGKLAHVTQVNENTITVVFKDSPAELKVEKEKWRTVEYNINKNTDKIEENEIGSFTQYPLRLAWAITIHKSQGLTFDTALIDAGQSFASGQVYVALSRCRRLDGIYLLSSIHAGSIINDDRIIDFALKETSTDEIKSLLEAEKYKYAAQLLIRLFDYHKLVRELERLDTLTQPKKTEPFDIIKRLTAVLYTKVLEQQSVADKFISELDKKFNDVIIDKDWLNKKVPAGKAYFINKIQDELIAPLATIANLLKGKSKVRQYVKYIQDVHIILHKKLNDIHKAAYLDLTFDTNLPEIKQPEQPVKPAPVKSEKGSSKRITLDMYKQGIPIKDIAEQRAMAVSTIESHLADSYDTGEINIADFADDTLLNKVKELGDKLGFNTLGPIKAELDPAITYAQLKMAVAYWKNQLEKNSNPASI